MRSAEWFRRRRRLCYTTSVFPNNQRPTPNTEHRAPNTEHRMRTILATDCGSTTTKAILIEKLGDTYRQTVRGEAPTTVEAPFDDVTVGVLNAVREVEELSGRTIIGTDGTFITPARDEKTGVDL